MSSVNHIIIIYKRSNIKRVQITCEQVSSNNKWSQCAKAGCYTQQLGKPIMQRLIQNNPIDEEEKSIIHKLNQVIVMFLSNGRNLIWMEH